MLKSGSSKSSSFVNVGWWLTGGSSKLTRDRKSDVGVSMLEYVEVVVTRVVVGVMQQDVIGWIVLTGNITPVSVKGWCVLLLKSGWNINRIIIRTG